jgi:uncharacterized membrane protein HdeD (DUF308 family)
MTELPTAGTDTAASWSSPVTRERADAFVWWTVLILGVVTVLFGAAVLIWPDVTLHVMAILVGIWLLLAGIVRIFGAFLPGAGAGRQVLSGIVGVILFIGGMLCLRNLVNALAVLALMVALSWMFGGLAEILMGIATGGAMRVALIVVGALSLLAGFVFLFAPGLSLAALVLMTGISAIVIGIGELVAAFQLRRLAAA